MTKQRNANYDLLRVVSMIAVIMIHVSSQWVGSFSRFVAAGGRVEDLTNPLSACFWSSISRFAVPCFLMLSGAFLLDDDRTANYIAFYKNRIKNVFVPTALFSVLYFIYRIIICVLANGADLKQLAFVLYDFVRGEPFYHMWYLYMLLGVYLLAPIVMRLKKEISYDTFRKIVFLFLVLATLSGWTTENVRMNWSVGQSFEYLGYFMVGFVIKQDATKNNTKGTMLIIIGFLIEIVTSFVEYKFQIVEGIHETELAFRIVSPFSPPIVVASVLIFSGFAMVDIKNSSAIDYLSKKSFTVFLFHAGVIDFFEKLLKQIKGKSFIMTLNNLYYIPLFVVAVFLISLLLSIAYDKIKVFYLRKYATA